MIDLEIGGPGNRPTYTLAFVEPAFSVTIGSTSLCNIRLPTRLITSKQIWLEERDGACTIVNVIAPPKTRVNGRQIDLRELATGDRIEVAGLHALFTRVRPAQPYTFADDTEARLAAAVAAGDEHSSLVYTDWLEQHGDDARTAYVRALRELRGWDFEQRAALGALATRVDPAWRFALSRR